MVPSGRAPDTRAQHGSRRLRGWLGSARTSIASPTDQQAMFLAAVAQFVEDLRVGGPFRKGLRVKGVQGASGVFEITWADDGRATFQYGDADRLVVLAFRRRECSCGTGS